MRSMVFALLCLSAMVPALGADPPAGQAKKHYLVEMSCGPDDSKAVTATLRTALALREDQSTVTLFIDVAAVHVAKPASDVQPVELQRETDRLFDKLRTAGVVVLVCPHCAEQHGLQAKSLRPSLRFTNKEELEAERKRADKVYEYRPADEKPAEVQKVAADRTT